MSSANLKSASLINSPIIKSPIALTIAGSDSSGGAGIQADLKTFSALGVYGATVITAITAQNTQGVRAVEALPPSLVQQQIQAVLDDLKVNAIKTGMLHNSEIIEVVTNTIKTTDVALIVDPVMLASSGDSLLDGEKTSVINSIKKNLLPIATLVTPNLDEAAALLNSSIAESIDEMEQQAKRLLMLGCKSVLLKGGHLNSKYSADVFASQTEVKRFEFEKVQTQNTHGTGCTLASAIAAGLAKGQNLQKAIAEARHYIHSCLVYADKLTIGSGAGPVNHFYNFC